MSIMKSFALLIGGLLIFSGCASVLVTDDLSSQAEKGYVEFFAGTGKSPLLINITQLVDGKERPVGNTGSFSAGKHRRVACLPGSHTFIVRSGQGVKRIDVVVSRQMITPVVIQYRLQSKSQNTVQMSTYTRIRADYDVVALKSIPVDRYEQDLVDLKKTEWGDSLPAAGLGMGQTAYDVDAIVVSPPGVPVGYVEFIPTGEGKKPGLNVTVHYRDPRGDIAIRSPNSRGFYADIDRCIARCPAGTNTLVFSSASGRMPGESFNVVVQEGWVTPVEVHFSDLDTVGLQRFARVKVTSREPRPLDRAFWDYLAGKTP